MLRRLLFLIRGLSELSGSLSDTAFPSQRPNSAAIVKVRRNLVSDLLLLPGSLYKPHCCAIPVLYNSAMLGQGVPESLKEKR